MATSQISDNLYTHPRAVQIFTFKQVATAEQQKPAETSVGAGRRVFDDACRNDDKNAESLSNTTSDNTTSRPNFERDILRKILCHESVRGVPVVPICVAGPHRSGKSFLLNFMLRYLNSLPNIEKEENWETKDASQSKENGSSSATEHAWLGGGETKADDGFSWQFGTESHTEGIWIWSRAIRVRQDGKDYAIVLLDTQGTHDMKASNSENIVMLALSSLLSSVFINNIRGGLIGSDTLHHLNFFVEYAEMATRGPLTAQKDDDRSPNKNHGIEDNEKPFQHLVFLVRDWQNQKKHPFGENSGYLDYILDVEDAGGRQYCPETRKIAKHIRDCFDSTSCFLLPNPGDCLGEEDFAHLNQASPKFQLHFPALVEWILNSDVTRAKRVGSETVTCSQLYKFAIDCVTTLSEAGEVPTLSTICDAHWKSRNLFAIEAAVDTYTKHMLPLTFDNANKMHEAEFEQLHDLSVSGARLAFRQCKLFGQQGVQTECLGMFEKQLNERKAYYQHLNYYRRDHKVVRDEIKEQHDTLQKLKDAEKKLNELKLAQVTAELEARIAELARVKAEHKAELEQMRKEKEERDKNEKDGKDKKERDEREKEEKSKRDGCIIL